MCATHRREAARLIERLLAAPQGFEFIQAVRILLAWLAGQGVAPEDALRKHLRFENSLHLGFPPGEIEGLALTALDDAGVKGFALTPSFMGLLGVHGTLPLHVTERIAAWQHARGDQAPRAFLDLLSGRMLALYYWAWHKYRIELSEHPQAGNGPAGAFLARLAALSGVDARNASLAGLPDALFAHFAGLLQQRPRSAAVLERLLAGYFGEAIRLEESVGHWNRLAPNEQPALGVNAQLGENTLLGERSWRPDLRARLRIGPLGRDAFARFLPGGPAAAALRAIVPVVAEPTVGFEVQLVLRGRDVAPIRLAGSQALGARLGRDSFLVGTDALLRTGAARADRTDMRYLVMPMAPLPPMPAKKRQARAA